MSQEGEAPLEQSQLEVLFLKRAVSSSKCNG